MDLQIDLSPLQRAIESLERALAQPKDEFVRDSVIQRFEYTYELAWKLLKRHLSADEGADSVAALSRKDLYRLAAQKGIIDDVLQWFAFHAARNESSHAYNESRAEQVYEVARSFAVVARALLVELESRGDDSSDSD